jgi:RNA polymerase sigma-70 factor, ECF subfamily
MSIGVRSEQAQVSDVELLHSVSHGDEAALARLYDRHRAVLFGLLLRILNNRDEAEDVLQDVFIQVWRRAGDFDASRGKPFTWLVTLARSRAIDRLRSLGSRQRTALNAAENEAEQVSDALADTARSEQRQIVERALAELPDDQRHALVLAYLDGMTQSEIATVLGTPLGTIKTRMRSGMNKLRTLLKPHQDNFGYSGKA